MEWSGIVVDTPGTLVGLGNLGSPVVLLSLFGLTLMAALIALRIRGALLIGILSTTVLGALTGFISYSGLFSLPPSLAPTFLALDIPGAFSLGLLDVIFIFFFLDLFDTIGTLIGVAESAGFMENGKLPRARNALLADALGTVGGALLGTSTVTSYIESTTGVAEGGRTGTANLITSGLFLVSLFAYPLIAMVGQGVSLSPDVTLYPSIAPVLIIVGLLMFKLTRKIPWDDPVEAIPSYLAMIVMPLTFSITEGIAFGFISYAFLSLISGRIRSTSWIVYAVAVLFLIRYAYLHV